jgi:thiol:disulfide interchange protein DsbA
MLNRAPSIVSNNYKVETVPTIVVDGKYVTSPGLLGETTHAQSQQHLFQETLLVVDALITKVQKLK